ncbi:ABC transporter substrate-binding protein [Catenovulum agarivorans]|uniref:ABC transporter substrate-binding protein n=1 Tax=Catenovulum agarivorans TaxID=1172192 RepID=UPI0002F9E5A3|nr:ABC transporter substrate-binding protein [Catenovulum agarivorans]
MLILSVHCGFDCVMTKHILSYLLIILVSWPSYATKILFINPDKPGRNFWDVTTIIAVTAAKQLGVDLEVTYGGGNRFSNQFQLENLTDKYDYVIFFPHAGNAISSFEVLSQLKTPFITLERAISNDELNTLGDPAHTYPLWIGEIYYDDVQAGALLTKELLAVHEKTSSRPASILAFNGDYSSISSKRAMGLSIISKQENAQLEQVLHTMWNPELAGQKFLKAILRYPDTNIVWAASDQLSLNISKISGETNLHSNLIVGGIDWESEAISGIESNTYAVSIGGHIFEAAWAIILAYDHAHTVDITNVRKQLPLAYHAITQENIHRFGVIKDSSVWPCFNFRKYSRHLNQAVKQHNFDLTLGLDEAFYQCIDEQKLVQTQP